METDLDSARDLGVRTAELHLALTADPERPAFAPESSTSHYVRGLSQSMRNTTTHNLRSLRKRLPTLPPETAALAQRVIDHEQTILNCYLALRDHRLSAKRIRCHGDLDLTEALFNGKDFTLIDFEGDPAAPVSERTIKHSALRDVASMMRSFHYAAWAGLCDHVQRGGLDSDCINTFEPWARLWYRAVSLEYLRAYLARANADGALAQSEAEVTIMLPAYLFNEAMHELGHELTARPDWLHIPLRGILSLLGLLEASTPAGENVTESGV
jgi:maltose alpha-D-glucosyltransferase/alpha-amylase